MTKCETKLGARSTALEALRGADLSGKTAVITGANSGIGVETARALAHAGADVIISSRSTQAGEEVAEQLRKSEVKGKITVRQLDLADLQSVKSFAEGISNELPQLDLLILNAGVMGLPEKKLTKDGFELQIGTNHIGHQYLTQLLLPKLKAAPYARVVAVSSVGHRINGLDVDDLNFENRKYGAWAAYGQSKLANILFAKELARRANEDGYPTVHAYSLHPGAINTNLSRYMKGGAVWRFFVKVFSFAPGVKSIEQGAATTVYAATAPELETQSGAYLADCAVAKPLEVAEDKELAKKLWDKTEVLIGDALKKREA